MEWFQENYLAVISLIALLLSELMAMVPSMKSNSIFQLVLNLLNALKGKK